MRESGVFHVVDSQRLRRIVDDKYRKGALSGRDLPLAERNSAKAKQIKP